MKCLFIVIALSISSSAFACVDISGKYLIGNIFFIKYEQKACESLTERFCSADGKDCITDSDSYTWPLTGEMVQVGGNPSKWASITPKGASLYRHQLWDSGADVSGQQCWWRDQVYAKDSEGNLNVNFIMSCLQGGKYKEVVKTEVWKLVQ